MFVCAVFMVCGLWCLSFVVFVVWEVCLVLVVMCVFSVLCTVRRVSGVVGCAVCARVCACVVCVVLEHATTHRTRSMAHRTRSLGSVAQKTHFMAHRIGNRTFSVVHQNYYLPYRSFIASKTCYTNTLLDQ